MKRDTREIPYDCPIEATLGLIGGKWKALILDHLTDGALRFGSLQRLMPKVTPKMEYELTDFGQTVLPILDAMCVWGREYLDDQRKKDRKKS